MKTINVSEMKEGDRAWIPGTNHHSILSIDKGRVVEMVIDYRGGVTRPVLGDLCYHDADGYLRGVNTNDGNYPVLVIDQPIARQ